MLFILTQIFVHFMKLRSGRDPVRRCLIILGSLYLQMPAWWNFMSLNPTYLNPYGWPFHIQFLHKFTDNLQVSPSDNLHVSSSCLTNDLTESQVTHWKHWTPSSHRFRAVAMWCMAQQICFKWHPNAHGVLWLQKKNYIRNIIFRHTYSYRIHINNLQKMYITSIQYYIINSIRYY